LDVWAQTLLRGEHLLRRDAADGAVQRESLDAAFVRDMAKQARWTFQRILKLTKLFGSSSEDDYQKMWEALRWNGTNGR
jgi:hypothetical protein